MLALQLRGVEDLVGVALLGEEPLPAEREVLVDGVARDTIDQDFALGRQRFLAEQGYSYEILDAAEL